MNALWYHWWMESKHIFSFFSTLICLKIYMCCMRLFANYLLPINSIPIRLRHTKPASYFLLIWPECTHLNCHPKMLNWNLRWSDSRSRSLNQSPTMYPALVAWEHGNWIQSTLDFSCIHLLSMCLFPATFLHFHPITTVTLIEKCKRKWRMDWIRTADTLGHRQLLYQLCRNLFHSLLSPT